MKKIFIIILICLLLSGNIFAYESNNQEPINIQIVNYAKVFLGYNYIYGGASPKGFDCSGFTWYIMNHFGFSINRTCEGQKENGKIIEFKDLLPGDIVLFERTHRAYGCTHAGIYIGDQLFIHAENPIQGVVISNITKPYYNNHFVCGVRVWPEEKYLESIIVKPSIQESLGNLE